MKKIFISFLIAHFAFLISQWGVAQIIHVPANQPTIQAGIDAANDGDTVLVADGTYLENINFNGKAITVASHFLMDADTNHINNTVIDGSEPDDPDSASVVMFISGEDTTSLLCGFTITGGSGMYVPDLDARIGGGIVCYEAASKIIHNKITENAVNFMNNAWGGGIACIRETGNYWTVIEDNIVRDNQSIAVAGSATGAGMEIWGDTRIFNNIIQNNSCLCTSGQAAGGGAAHYSVNNPPDTLQFIGNVIINNTVDAPYLAAGGAVYAKSSIAVCIDNIIEYNHCTGYLYSHGGGIEMDYTDAILSANNIRYNSISSNDESAGGGLSLWYSKTMLANNDISYNTAEADIIHGAGLHFHHPDTLQLIENIITYNKAITDTVSWGAGVVCWNPEACVLMKNNEIKGNLSPMYKVPPIPLPVGAGGGIAILDALMNEVIVEGNYFKDDTAKTGGGFYSRDCYNLKLTNNLFYENVGYRGGAIAIGHLQTAGGEVHPLIVNMTAIENSSPYMGGAFWFTGNINAPYIFNSIFYGNTAPSGPEIRNLSTLPLEVSYCLINTDSITGNWEGIQNLYEDPQFAGTGEHPFALAEGSPCIDRGTSDTTGLSLPIWDFAGNLRIWDGDGDYDTIIDIGAYEYGAPPYNVGIVQPILSSEFRVLSYPNPTDGIVNFQVSIVDVQRISLKIFDLQGREVAAVLDENLPAGEHVVRFDASGLPDGIYLARLQAGEEVATGRIVKID